MSQTFTPRYEYATRVMPNDPKEKRIANEQMEAAGYQCVWADVDMSGVFAVYRRERRDLTSPA